MNSIKIQDGKIHAICYALCIFIFYLGHSKIQYLSPALSAISRYGKFVPPILSGVMLLCRYRINKKTAFFGMIFALMIAYCIVYNDMSYTVFFIAFFMIACRKVKETELYKYYFYSTILFFFLTIILMYLGIIENGQSHPGRYELGFIYTTYGPNLFLSAVIALICWKREKMTAGNWAFVHLINIYLYIKTNTDAVFLCLIALYIAVKMVHLRKFSRMLDRSKLLAFFFSHCFIICCIATFALQIYFNSHPTQTSMIWLNKRLSNRLIMGRNEFAKFNGNIIFQILFGLEPSRVDYLDSSYLALFEANGIIVLLVFCFCMDFIAKRIYLERNYSASVCLLVFAVHCITDPQLYSFRANPIIITFMIHFVLKKQNHPLGLKVQEFKSNGILGRIID